MRVVHDGTLSAKLRIGSALFIILGSIKRRCISASTVDNDTRMFLIRQVGTPDRKSMVKMAIFTVFAQRIYTEFDMRRVGGFFGVFILTHDPRWGSRRIIIGMGFINTDCSTVTEIVANLWN